MGAPWWSLTNRITRPEETLLIATRPAEQPDTTTVPEVKRYAESSCLDAY